MHVAFGEYAAELRDYEQYGVPTSLLTSCV